MNNVKKITAEVALEDFKKIMMFNLVNKIQWFFKGDYKSFWNAKDEFLKFRELCKIYGRQTPQLTHRVFNNIERFDRCSLPVKVVKAIFHDIPNYDELISKYLVTKHGTLSVTDKDGSKRLLRYGNIYRPESIEELAEILGKGSEHNLLRHQNLKGNFYTKRQKHIIIKYLVKKDDKSGEESSSGSVKVPVRAMKYVDEYSCPDLPVNKRASQVEQDNDDADFETLATKSIHVQDDKKEEVKEEKTPDKMTSEELQAVVDDLIEDL